MINPQVSGDVTLYSVENVRDVGVKVSSDLSWSKHVGDMVTKARSKLSWVLSVFKTRDKVFMMTLYKSLVRSLLEYCCPLWDPVKTTEIQLLEGVQRTFTSRIGGLYSLNYWERLAHLKLMSLQRRRERYIILMMWKTYHNIVPNSCSIEFVETSRYGTKAVVPSLSKSSSLRNQTLYDSSFAVKGPKLWNKVPSEVKAEKTFASFKVSLSKFLALIPDNPPVSGYTCSWSNSLVDYTLTRHHGGQTSDDPSCYEDKPYQVTKLVTKSDYRQGKLLCRREGTREGYSTHTLGYCFSITYISARSKSFFLARILEF